tara:strand:+ start:346 stop:540 length:195 start_codon:yes stop_codon:yes gene_type:complete
MGLSLAEYLPTDISKKLSNYVVRPLQHQVQILVIIYLLLHLMTFMMNLKKKLNLYLMIKIQKLD